jgi:hypothetical protein
VGDVSGLRGGVQTRPAMRQGWHQAEGTQWLDTGPFARNGTATEGFFLGARTADLRHRLSVADLL